MGLDLYIIKDGERLRIGYTTGSCAAAASKGAALLLEGEKPDFVEIDTPGGVRLKLEVLDPRLGDGWASCGIMKDGGDDPDVTDGMIIYSRLSKREDQEIVIDGGEGIGRIKREGLFGKLGDPAINPVPRQMIKKELKEVSDSGYNVEIYAPLGERIGKKTFNKNIGIEGGISIIGSKGLVYPMSDQALIKTIQLEIDDEYERGSRESLILVPGNHGKNFAEKKFQLEGRIILMSNYIGEAISYAYSKGFKELVLVGHIGKFAKLAIGGFNTHSRVMDTRMEAFVYYLALMGADYKLLERVNSALTSEEALDICIDAGYGDIVRKMEEGCEKRIRIYLKDDEYKVSVKIYSMRGD